MEKGSGSRKRNYTTRNVGKYFTFFKFLDLVVKCAKVTFSGFSTGSESRIYANYKESQLMEGEMVCLLLERLELSRGFNNLEKKTNRPHTSKITLLPSKQVIAHLNHAKSEVLGNKGETAVASLLH